MAGAARAAGAGRCNYPTATRARRGQVVRPLRSGALRHRWISIDEQLFAGKNIFPLYNRYGPELNLGDPYFCTKFYSRTDAYAVLFDRKGLDVRLGVTLHASQGRPFGWWQAIKVSYNIGGTLYRKSSGQAAAHSTPLSDKL